MGVPAVMMDSRGGVVAAVGDVLGSGLALVCAVDSIAGLNVALGCGVVKFGRVDGAAARRLLRNIAVAPTSIAITEVVMMRAFRPPALGRPADRGPEMSAGWVVLNCGDGVAFVGEVIRAARAGL